MEGVVTGKALEVETYLATCVGSIAFKSSHHWKPLRGTEQGRDKQVCIFKDPPGYGLENEWWGGSQR